MKNRRSPSCLFAAVAIAVCSVCHAGNNGNAANGNIASPPVDAIARYNADGHTVYLLADDAAGPFHLGAVIPNELKGFDVSRSKEEATVSGKSLEIPVYIYEIGNEGWVKVTPQYDAETGRVNDRIGEIFVYSELFLTDKGIGAISSIAEFAATYPEFSIRRADEEKLFIVETPHLHNVQFLLRDEYYVGAAPDSKSSVSGKLKVSDFKKNSYFCAIRICRCGIYGEVLRRKDEGTFSF